MKTRWYLFDESFIHPSTENIAVQLRLVIVLQSEVQLHLYLLGISARKTIFSKTDSRIRNRLFHPLFKNSKF